MRLMMLPIAVPTLVSGCATHHDPGWQGSDAHPFGKANSIDQSEASGTTTAERDVVYLDRVAQHA